MTLPPISLQSNYVESYDYCFAPAGELIFHRMDNTRSKQLPQMSRRELFAFMEARGIQTVPHGIVKELVTHYSAEEGVVVYLDEYAHLGNGKVRLSREEALARYPDYYASLFIGPAGQCQRHFQFGTKSFLMPFFSADDWRCQKGRTFSWCVPGEVEPLFLEKVALPYFAIDYIPGTRMATDMQVCPGTRDDGLDRFMTPRQMYQALQEAARLLLDAGKLEGGPHLGYGLSIAQ